MGSLNRNLGRAKLELHGHALFLQELSAQDKLELTAASVMGQWLLIESEEFKAFGALPDLTVGDDQRKVAVDPMPLLKKFTLGVAPNVYAEQEDAWYFSKIYPPSTRCIYSRKQLVRTLSDTKLPVLRQL